MVDLWIIRTKPESLRFNDKSYQYMTPVAKLCMILLNQNFKGGDLESIFNTLKMIYIEKLLVEGFMYPCTSLIGPDEIALQETKKLQELVSL